MLKFVFISIGAFACTTYKVDLNNFDTDLKLDITTVPI